MNDRRPLVPAIGRIGLGCAPLGNLYEEVAEEAATAVVDAAWEGGIRYFDTAPLYGHGLSERRLGQALANRPRDEFVVSTKVGRLLRPATAPIDTIFTVPDAPGALAPVFDFSAEGVRRSLDESLERLGLDRVDIVFVHDPDDHHDDALTGAFPVLLAMRDQGIVRAVGAGMNQWQALDRFVRQVDLDVVLLAGRYTLLDQSGAETLLPRCVERGVDVVLGGVFNSGILATGTNDATYDYAPASSEIKAHVEALRRSCAGYGVALGAAAVQYPLRHHAVTSVVVGARSAAELAQDLAWAHAEIPDVLWTALGAANASGPDGYVGPSGPSEPKPPELGSPSDTIWPKRRQFREGA
jgi:D-threo-aldose 1-dehydrogenase